MLILTIYNDFRVIKFKNSGKLIQTTDNNYLSSIEYVDNGYDDVITKEIDNSSISFFNLKNQYHNPIGPAFINYNLEGKISYEVYYENGIFIRDVGY